MSGYLQSIRTNHKCVAAQRKWETKHKGCESMLSTARIPPLSEGKVG